MKDKFLPIGTIVTIHNQTKKIMITGYCIENSETNKKYDYCGCYYPEGIITSNKIAVFNNEQIENVVFIGYINDESVKLVEKFEKIDSQQN